MENKEYILSDISEYLKVKGSYAVAIAYERCLLNLTAMFPFKTAADVVAFVAGSAFGITDDKLSAGSFPQALVFFQWKRWVQKL